MEKLKPIVYETLPEPNIGITDSEVLIQTLKHPNMDRVSHCTVEKPKGGEVYVFQLSSLRSPQDIKCDLYTWKQTCTYHFPESASEAERRYYAVVVDHQKCFEFKRIIVTLKGACDFAMVQYVGNEKVYQGHVHGISKSQNREYFRESPSVKDCIIQKGDDKTTSALYRDMVGKSAGHSAIYIPRNPKKVENVKQEYRRSRRLTHDAIYNVRELSFHLPRFIQSFNIAPDIVLNLVYTQLLDTLHDVLATSDITYPTYFCYDTTFQLGDFYVSTLSFRHSLLKGAPVIPIAFMIHDRKFQRDHDTFIENFLQLINKTRIKGEVAFVTDREFDFQRLLPENMFHVYCWLHLKKNVREFVLYRIMGGESQAAIYVDCVHDLMNCISENEYLVRKDVESRKWTESFLDYFNEHLDPVIRKRCGRWVLEKLGIYSLNSGITTNCAESVNTILKRLLVWTERPLDVVVLALFELCKFLQHEIKRALHGTGKFTLDDQFRTLPLEDLPRMPITMDPDNIVDVLKQACVNGSAIDHLEGQENVADGLNKPVELAASSKIDDFTITEEHNASKCMAQRVLDEGRISFVPERKAFLVEGSDDKRYAVTLFPKQACQCPATKTCYHISAAIMYIGGDATLSKPGPVNLQMLSKRSRKTADKRSGRKRPRASDYEIVAAPDSREADDGVIVKCVSSQPIPPKIDKPLRSVTTEPMEASAERAFNAAPAPSISGSVPHPIPQLLAWGSPDGTLSNTCSMDNLLSLCFIAYKDSSSFVENLKNGTSNAELNLGLVMTLMEAGNLLAAKKCWVAFLEQDKRISAPTNGRYDLWGSELESFICSLMPTFAIVAEDFCEHEDTCPRPKRIYRIGIISPDKVPLQSALDSIIAAHSVECNENIRVTTANRQNTKKSTIDEIEDDGTVRTVRTTECNGLRNVFDFKFDHDNVFLLPIYLKLNKWTIEDAMGLPEVINVLSKTFYLRGYTVSLGNHFVAYVWWHGKYYYYDGLAGGITQEIPTNMVGNANYALYTV